MEMPLLQFREKAQKSHKVKVQAEDAAVAQCFEMRGIIDNQLQMIAEMKVQKTRYEMSLMELERTRNSAEADY